MTQHEKTQKEPEEMGKQGEWRMESRKSAVDIEKKKRRQSNKKRVKGCTGAYQDQKRKKEKDKRTV